MNLLLNKKYNLYIYIIINEFISVLLRRLIGIQFKTKHYLRT